MVEKEKILDLYYNQGLKQKEIAEQLLTTPQHVSKIIKNDSRYTEEKERRAQKTQERNKEYQRNYQKNYKRNYKKDDEYANLQAQLSKDADELSYHSEISDYSFAKWNSSAYHTTAKGNLAINKNLNVGIDVPRNINMNLKVPSQKYKPKCYMER